MSNTNPIKPGTLTARVYSALVRTDDFTGPSSARKVALSLARHWYADADCAALATEGLADLAILGIARAYQGPCGCTYWTAIPEDLQRATAVSDDQSTATIGATCPVEFTRRDETTVELEATGERCYVYESARGVVAWFTVGTRALVRIDSSKSRRTRECVD